MMRPILTAIGVALLVWLTCAGGTLAPYVLGLLALEYLRRPLARPR